LRYCDLPPEVPRGYADTLEFAAAKFDSDFAAAETEWKTYLTCQNETSHVFFSVDTAPMSTTSQSDWVYLFLAPLVFVLLARLPTLRKALAPPFDDSSFSEQNDFFGVQIPLCFLLICVLASANLLGASHAVSSPNILSPNEISRRVTLHVATFENFPLFESCDENVYSLVGSYTQYIHFVFWFTLVITVCGSVMAVFLVLVCEIAVGAQLLLYALVAGMIATAVLGVITFVVSFMNLNEVARVLTAPQINGNWKIYCHNEGFELCDEHTRIYAIFKATVFCIFPMGWVFFVALQCACHCVSELYNLYVPEYTTACPTATRSFIYLWSFIIYSNEAWDDDTNAVIIDTNTVAIDYSMLKDLRSVEAPAYAKTSLVTSSIRNLQQTSFLSTASSTLNSQGAECCATCLEEFGKDEQLQRLECGHHFHKACLDSWLGSGSQNCPLCRRAVRHEGGPT
jgi:hypothetical protein